MLHAAEADEGKAAAEQGTVGPERASAGGEEDAASVDDAKRDEPSVGAPLDLRLAVRNVGAFGFALDRLEKIAHQQRAAPCIDQDVVIAHDEPMPVGSEPDQSQAQGRALQQIETGFALRLQQRLQTLFVLGCRQHAPVENVHTLRHLTMDDLQHGLAGIPAEGGTQRLVSRHHHPPRAIETLDIQLAVDGVAVLHEIDAGAGLQQGMQQQAFLHRRERIDVFDGVRRDRQGIELRLAQAHQWKIRRRDAADAGEIEDDDVELLAFVAVGAQQIEGVGGELRAWWVAAIVLSLLGDVFLMLPSDRFVFGLVSFLLAHLAYIGGFLFAEAGVDSLALPLVVVSVT